MELRYIKIVPVITQYNKPSFKEIGKRRDVEHAYMQWQYRLTSQHEWTNLENVESEYNTGVEIDLDDGDFEYI